MAVVIVFSVLAVLLFGVLFFRLHHLPEHIAHKSQKVQYEIVAVLGLIAMFTHKNIFWVIGLLLALIDLPDFGTPLNRIAGSTEKMAGLKPGKGLTEIAPETIAGIKRAKEAAEGSPRAEDIASRGEGRPALRARSEIIPIKKEVGHA
jgi:hypothetical protein